MKIQSETQGMQSLDTQLPDSFKNQKNITRLLNYCYKLIVTHDPI